MRGPVAGPSIATPTSAATAVARATAIAPGPTPATVATATAAPTAQAARPAVVTDPTPRQLPLWYGFNLQEKFNADWGVRRFQERELEWMAELGFNFVRVPMDYRWWTEPHNWSVLRQAGLEEIDQLLRWGERYGLHVCLNFHRAPGYSITPPAEAKSLWSNDEAQHVCALHWANFAHRYRAIPNRLLSFNLVNEPPQLDPALHHRVMARLAASIRKEDEKRLLICDGASWGTAPPHELAGLNVAVATRGYEPMRLTHYQAEWINGADGWPVPSYPAAATPEALAERETARRQEIEPWRELQARGVGIMVGEFGAYSRSPHAAVLAWMRERLRLWRDAGWGWAMWNFSGPFGVIDSGRADVKFERWRGVQLDRAMLDVLRDFLPGGIEAKPGSRP